MANSSANSVLVYDVGGSHIAAAVCSDGLQLGRIVRAPHPAEQTSDAFIGVLYSLASQAVASSNVLSGSTAMAGASVAMPGPFDYEAGVSRARHKLPYLYGVDLLHALALRFGWQPEQVRFLNDAAAYLLGEIGAGAARGAARAVGVTLGTGIGASFAVDGRVVREGPGVPPGGEIWNQPYDSGIVEDSLASRTIQANYQRRTGAMRTVAEIAAAAPADSDATAVFAEYGRHLGRALRLTLAPFAPDAVVLGGSISHAADLFLPAAERELAGLSFRLQVSTLFDRAPLIGAGLSWFRSASVAPSSVPSVTQAAD
jgi:glucokinase